MQPNWTEDHIKEYLNYAYLEIGDAFNIETQNPFEVDLQKDGIAEDLVKVFKNIDYMPFTVKTLLNMNLFPYQMAILNTLWTKRLPMLIATRGGSKTTMLGCYAITKALLDQGSKIVIAGAGLRQSGLVFESMENIWKNAPILQDICGANNGPRRGVLGFHWDIGDSKIMGIPIGTGEKIRGLRANTIIVDEFGSVNPDIFETVIRGFASVQSNNTFEKVKQQYQIDALKAIGMDNSSIEDFLGDTKSEGNQIILAGTATYQFNHFFKYYQDYCNLIYEQYRNGMANLSEYAVIRLPWDYLPNGLMDKTILEQGKATMDTAIFKMEYGCVFAKDSDGFYPASAIHKATCPIKTQNGELKFYAEEYGEKNCRYVMGVDPASERDNFAISVVKITDEYRGLVFCWSTNRKRFESQKKKKPHLFTGIEDYNTFIIRKIHEICSRFNISRIHLDSGGGGRSVVEGLKDPSKLKDNEYCIFDMNDEEVSDRKGAHIVNVIEFSSREWYESAHFNLLKDITTMSQIFPAYDAVGVEQARMSAAEDELDDMSLENIQYEIEECKYQTTLIQEQTTAKGNKTWDLPRIKGVVTEGIKTRLRKDHFTSLLLANDAARSLLNTVETPQKHTFGGFSSKEALSQRGESSQMYQGKGLKRMKNAQNINNRSNFVRRADGPGGSIAY
jgi:hypothetical protein